ncbi:hypothetical protein QTP70_017993, partial [Hemibagrus guttatus]
GTRKRFPQTLGVYRCKNGISSGEDR